MANALACPVEKRWGARAVESGSLENCYTSNGIVSSNLTPTAFLRGREKLVSESP